MSSHLSKKKLKNTSSQTCVGIGLIIYDINVNIYEVCFHMFMIYSRF
jgi:hypothetical protein